MKNDTLPILEELSVHPWAEKIVSVSADVLATLRIRGRDYTVAHRERINTLTGEVERGYCLTGKRGATYFTMRNARNPDKMFVVAHSLGSSVMSGVWLSDAGGELRVVCQ